MDILNLQTDAAISSETLYNRRLETSPGPLRKPQISHYTKNLFNLKTSRHEVVLQNASQWRPLRTVCKYLLSASKYWWQQSRIICFRIHVPLQLFKVKCDITEVMPISRRSQRPHGLRCRSATARLLRSWVRIPPGAWMFVCCECCVLSGRGLCDELITRPEESYRLCCVVVCDLETSRMRRPLPTLGRSATTKQKVPS